MRKRLSLLVYRNCIVTSYNPTLSLIRVTENVLSSMQTKLDITYFSAIQLLPHYNKFRLMNRAITTVLSFIVGILSSW